MNKIDRLISKGEKMIRGKFLILSTILIGTLFSIGCEKEYEYLVITAQVAKTLDPESNTATLYIGRTIITNLFLEEPDPNDTLFADDPFPVTVEPISGALVKVNETVLSEKTKGVYFEAALDLEYMKKYDLYIEVDDEIITGTCVLPDSFSIITPVYGDTVSNDSTRVVWSKSDSAEHYIVGVQPVDTLNQAQGWCNCLEDTFSTVPRAAFEDSLGFFCPGEYSISLMAFNGAWKKGALDLFLSGGNLDGASGIYGAAVYSSILVVNVRD